ncbi:MAG: vWA domain-containing protein [Verrucomicrobiota bacterium]
MNKRIFTLLLTTLAFAQADIDSDLDRELRDQTATSISIIFDDSGSMAPNGKIGQAKRAFSAWLSAQSEDTRFSLLHFANGGQIAVPLDKNTRDEVARRVQQLSPEYNTPITQCLRLAGAQIQKRQQQNPSSERHIVVIFTDGHETQDRRGNQGVVEEVNNLTSQGIEVVGIGFHGQGDYMQNAVTNYYTADNETELAKGLAQVAAEVPIDADFEITESEKKLMAQASAIPLSDPSTSQPQPSPESDPKKKTTFPFIFIIALFIIVTQLFKGFAKK